MLAHRLRRWPNIKSALVQRLVFAGYYWQLLEYHIKKQIYLVGLIVKRATFWWTRLIYQSGTGIHIKVARVTYPPLVLAPTKYQQWHCQYIGLCVSQDWHDKLGITNNGNLSTMSYCWTWIRILKMERTQLIFRSTFCLDTASLCYFVTLFYFETVAAYETNIMDWILKYPLK